jgi:hypothetical protein
MNLSIVIAEQLIAFTAKRMVYTENDEARDI